MNSENHDLNPPVTHPPCYTSSICCPWNLLFTCPSLCPCPSLSQSYQLWSGICPRLLVSAWFWGFLYFRFGTWLSFNHSNCSAPFKSFWFLPISSVRVTPPSHLQLSHSVSVLTVGINPITILPLKLGTGNISNVLISTWLWTPCVEGLRCIFASPFPSLGPGLNRCQYDVFMGWKVIRLCRLFISCAKVRT